MQRIKCCRMPPADLRAARANRVFRTDALFIRPENTVPEKGNPGLGLHLSKIADYVDT